jgi:phage FluMu protein Com
MHRDGDERGLLGCGAGEVGAMTRWGEIKCPRCEELEAKLERAEDFLRRLERFSVQNSDRFLIEKTQQAIAELIGGTDDRVQN